MTCPLCGIGLLPGKVCLNCGYDPSKPGVRPTAPPKFAPAPPPVADEPVSMKDLNQAVSDKKAAKKQKEKPAARAAFSDADEIFSQIDRIDQAPAPPPPPAARQTAPKQAAPLPPAAPPPAAAPAPARATLQQASVPVTTQFAFEGRHIGGYAGLVTAAVVVRIGGPEELMPEGQDIQRLSGGPVGMKLRRAIDIAIADLKTEAVEKGANGVVGARLEVLPGQGPLAIVTLIGTAVILE